MPKLHEVLDRNKVQKLLIKSVFFGFIGLSLLIIFFTYTQHNWLILIDPSSGYPFQSALLNSGLFLAGAVSFFELARWTFNLNEHIRNHIYAILILIVIALIKTVHFSLYILI